MNTPRHPARPAGHRSGSIDRARPAPATPDCDRSGSIDRARPATPDSARSATPDPRRSGSLDHDRPFGTVVIVGLGLIGGSLARALTALPRPPLVTASSHSGRDLERAERAGVIESGATEPAALLHAADLVVYATPLDATLQLLPQHRSAWPAHAAVTDVASLKAPVEEALRALGESARYTGSHPMAGGEGSGFAHSTADLFAGATVWLTGSGAWGGAVEGLWGAVGARPCWTAAADHDERMAWCSHLPQLTATALARVLETSSHAPSDLGTGGTDMVRLAASSPEMWLPLLTRSEVGEALRRLARAVEEMADAVEGRDLEAIEGWMRRTRAWHTRTPDPPPGTEGSPP